MYCEVILSQRFPKHLGIFDYKIPADLVSKIKIGQLITIPFRKSEREGIIIKLKKTGISGVKIKQINSIIQNNPIITPEQIILAEWIAKYYFVSLGTIIKTMLPPIPKKKMKLKETTFRSVNSPKKIDKVLIKKIISTTDTKLFYNPANNKERINLLYGLLKKAKRQVLIIVPTKNEIKALVNSMPEEIHNTTAIIHSGLNKTQYFSSWQSIINNKNKIIIGTKLALFSPLIKPELIILDQEDNQNHKQSDQNPRFDSRKVMQKMSEIYNTKLLFINQSITLNTYYQSINNEFTNLKKLEDIPKKSLQTIDMKQEQKKQNYSPLSEDLQNLITSTLAEKKQVYLFINKRGGSSSVICKDCGENLNCDNCKQPLTFHTKDQSLYCHQCNKKIPLLSLCPKCHGPNFKFVGTGTQKVENETKKLFPNKKIIRLDKDEQETDNMDTYDIIIGTEYALNYIDWNKIGLVGVISADTFLYLPDFTSTERTWHILNKLLYLSPSDTVIQTYSPDNSAIKYLNKNNQELFYESELSDRESLQYPPYSNIIQLIYSHKDKSICLNETKKLYSKLHINGLKTTIITPLRPFINNKWQMYIIIKYLPKTEEKLISEIMKKIPNNWVINRDPINLL